MIAMHCLLLGLVVFAFRQERHISELRKRLEKLEGK